MKKLKKVWQENSVLFVLLFILIACLVANDANLLLIDEPVAGIDENNRLKISEVIKELRRAGKTIIQIEHNRDYISQTSDCIIKMEGGKISC